MLRDMRFTCKALGAVPRRGADCTKIAHRHSLAIFHCRLRHRKEICGGISFIVFIADSIADPPFLAFWISLFFLCDSPCFSGRVTPKILGKESKNAPQKQGKSQKEKTRKSRKQGKGDQGNRCSLASFDRNSIAHLGPLK